MREKTSFHAPEEQCVKDRSAGTLNELKLLTNWNGGGKNFLTIILLGQPELRNLVCKLPPINQRISLRFHLNALGMPEVGAYLQHRLRAAGHPTGDLFPLETAARLFQASNGIPRELNRLAKLGLELSWVKHLPQVTVPAVDAVIRDLSRHQNFCVA